MSGAAQPSTGAVVGSKYEIVSVLGAGRSGKVYLARHLVTDRLVVLKWMIQRDDTDADDVERFIREARAVARVRHPNIVDIYDVGEVDGSVFLVMEYLRGTCWSEFLRKASLPPSKLVRLLLPALYGLHAAHQAGVIHRDLKPHNLFAVCDDDGRPITSKVLDFGIAKQRGTEDDLTLTQTGVVMGSPLYMAPEQAEDARSVDARVDVYAMGVTLYQALSGQLPYRATSLPALLLQVTRGDSVPLHVLCPALPAKLCDVVMRAMAVDRAQRFESMAALAKALEPFAERTIAVVSAGQVHPVLEPTSCVPEVVAGRAKRRKTVLATALVSLVGLAGYVGVEWRDSSRDALNAGAVHGAPLEPAASPHAARRGAALHRHRVARLSVAGRLAGEGSRTRDAEVLPPVAAIRVEQADQAPMAARPATYQATEAGRSKAESKGARGDLSGDMGSETSRRAPTAREDAAGSVPLGAQRGRLGVDFDLRQF